MSGRKDKEPDGLTSKMLTTGEAARILNVHPSTVRRWSDQGKIASFRPGPGGKRLFRQEDITILYLYRAIQYKGDQEQ